MLASCRCCTSRERNGNTAARPTCSAGWSRCCPARRLGAFLAERILRPLGMADTGFSVPEQITAASPSRSPRIPETGADVVVAGRARAGGFESGGGGMVGTAMDYAAFCDAAERRTAGRHTLARPQDRGVDDFRSSGRHPRRRRNAAPRLRLRPGLRRAAGGGHGAFPGRSGIFTGAARRAPRSGSIRPSA